MAADISGDSNHIANHSLAKYKNNNKRQRWISTQYIASGIYLSIGSSAMQHPYTGAAEVLFKTWSVHPFIIKIWDSQ
jgi:hypothetical protein